MKVIVFFVGEYPNGFSPMSRRLHYYMLNLHSEEIDVEVVMPSTVDRPNGVFEGIPYRYILVNKYGRLSLGRQSVEYINICKELSKECDVLFEEGINFIYLGQLADAVHSVGGKIVAEINENPGSIRGTRFDYPFILKIKQFYIKKYCLKELDGIVAISSSLEAMLKKYCNKTKIIRIPILSDNKFRTIVHSPNPADGIPYILHAGALSEQKDGIIEMLKAFVIANKYFNGKLKFVFTVKKGFPALLQDIDDIVKTNNLEESIVFKGVVSNEELVKLRDNCSLCIVNKPSNAQNDYNFPTKISEILPCRIPLIVSNTGELKRYFVNNENAIVVEPNNVKQIAEGIVYIIEHPDHVKRMTQKGFELCNDFFRYDIYARPLGDFFKSFKK